MNVKAVQYHESQGIPLSLRIEVIQSGSKRVIVKTSNGCSIRTLEGNMKVNDGDYIIRGTHGEFYPCRQDIFEENYEEVTSG